MTRKKYILLYPLSLIYGFITWFKNFLYNTEILTSREFTLPVICVGNITVGGTGKTPHCEYLVNLLKDRFKIALLSRGYRRSTKGFIIANPSSSTEEIGDEPAQIYLKNPDIIVAVDRKRVRGIENILRERPDTEVIILDDGFQHRRLIPGLSILLTDYNRLMINDYLLPYGELRESLRNMHRADIILVTKCPSGLTPIQRRIVVKDMRKAPYQDLYFTSYIYGPLMPVFSGKISGTKTSFPEEEAGKTDVLLVTGVANPDPLVEHVGKKFKEVKHLRFRDHYRYTENDIFRIFDSYSSITSTKKIIVTTEKDAVRLKELINIVPPEMRKSFYYIPVTIHFLNNDNEKFNNLIINYVRKNKRNNRFS
ncbi:MAG: tetraacyldisaccharide 4'-kinase [Bacteroidales bacterium]